MAWRLEFKNKDSGEQESHEIQWYRDFMEEHVHRAGLQIAGVLHKISIQPFFLVAATGLGKTVAVPIHLLLQLCESLSQVGEWLPGPPMVLVVEPTIPICRSEAEHMNASFQRFLRSKELLRPVHPFGAVTGSYKMNVDAPIRFITTGVFERMADQIDPRRCCVVIDEAHRVLAQSPGVEIAACRARDRGVSISWMSATVEPTDVAERFGINVILATDERYPILKIPMPAPLEECIGDVVLRCLTSPHDVLPEPEDFSSDRERAKCTRARLHMLSPESFTDSIDGQVYPGLHERAQGMLVVVNSHRGENSDTRRVADLIVRAVADARADITVLRLASAIVRDVDQEASFRRRVAGVEKRQGRYVIVATNVVEMGVTFPSLDYVVTMDTELETGRLSGVEEKALTPNSFFQRIGRVGRRRPGVALITREGPVGAAFSAWSVNMLAERLRLEPIAFAISNGNVRELTFSLAEADVGTSVTETAAYLVQRRLPSRPEREEAVLRAIAAEREAIRRAHLSDDGRRLNERGRTFRRVGVVADLELGSLLAECINRGGDLPYLGIAAAACAGGLRDLLGRRTWLDDDQPVLSHTVPIARDRLRVPIGEAMEVLRSSTEVSATQMGTDEATAYHMNELLAAGYRVDEPRTVQRDDNAEEPALLTLSRVVIRLDRESELLAPYDILRWFFDRYGMDLTDPNLAEYERERVRQALKREARQIGVDATGVLAGMTRTKEIARHAGVSLGAVESVTPLRDGDLLPLMRAANDARQVGAVGSIEREVRRLYRENVLPRRGAQLPTVSSQVRREFVGIVSALGLFDHVELSPTEDAGGQPVFSGNVSIDGRPTAIILERGRTSLRLSRTTGVRCRVVPIHYVDRDGRDAMRYAISQVTTVR
jgi:hypothetical protein